MNGDAYLRQYHFYSAMPPVPRWAAYVLLSVACWFAATHFAHVFSEAINWDEFALMARADRTLRFGEVLGDGRPGLVTLLLTVFVRDCADSIRSVLQARLFWQLVTLAYLAGVYCLVRQWHRSSGSADSGHPAGLLAVALLAFLPAFVTWSVQVRTDQAGLALATWGGFFLLLPGAGTAAVSGVLLGSAVLCTQKALYVAGLCAVLHLGALVECGRRTPSAARALAVDAARRAAVVAAAAVALVAIYLALVPEASRLVTSSGVASTMGAMNWTRASQGYRIYTVHAYRLVVHWGLLLVLCAWTARTVLRRSMRNYVPVATAWAVLLAGLAVARFHGSSFPYFIMTAGLFPAVALALTVEGPLTAAGRSAWAVLVSLVVLSAAQGAPESLEMLARTQTEQRETLRIVLDSALRQRRGYQVEGALFCARDPGPMPIMFSQDIWRRFKASPRAAENAARFVADLRERQVAYVVDSYRLRQLPPSILDFFGSHYVWYRHSLFVAGFRVQLNGNSQVVDVIVPGRYRWDESLVTPGAGVRVGPFDVPPGGTVALAARPYEVTSPDVAIGTLILADVPRSDEPGLPGFYLSRQIYQLGGWR